MLNVYDMNRRKTAVLQNAFNITETQELNKIYALDFQIPADDQKTQYLLPFHFVRYGDDGELYRIIKVERQDDDTPILSVSCEHVIAVLVDELMFGAIQYGGGTIKTADVIRYLLSRQINQNWILDECDFERRFEYLWEQENILNALYSIPREFTKAYKWTFDTTVYPWKLSLKAIDATIHPEFYIRAKRNMLSSGTEQDYTGICTRIYPLGYGEGVNQLGIKEINNGLPYLQSPAEIVAQYGIKEKVLVDRRYENAESLKEYAQTMLEGLQTPSMSRSFDVVDLYPLTSQDIDNAEVGKICKMTGDDTIAYVTKTVRVLDEAGNLKIDLSTKAIDVVSEIADLADRVRIETVYAQGATQLYQHSKDANATPSKGMIMSLYFPAEMRQINKVLMRLKLGQFRSYSQATENSAAITQTSSSGGGSNVTSSAGGGTTVTSSSGGGTGTTSTSSSGVSISGGSDTAWQYSSYNASTQTAYTGGTDGSGDNVDTGGHVLNYGENGNARSGYQEGSGDTHTHTTYVPYSHYHRITGIRLRIPTLNIPLRQFAHSHTFSASGGSHSHSFSISAHSHSVTINPHSHDVTIPAHKHDITPGIFESGSPTSFEIYVGGTYKATINNTSYDDDIATWLLDSDNQIPRNAWIDIEIRPNDLAYVQTSVFVQGFVGSRGGGNY